MGDTIIAATFPRPAIRPKHKEVLRCTKVYHLWGCIMPHKDPARSKEYHKEYYLTRAEEKKEWQRQYRIAHQEERAAGCRDWYVRHREQQKERAKRAQKELRLEVLAHYGGKCSFCGDSNTNHLSIDHINNDGAAHRREIGFGRSSGSKIYRWIKSNDFPVGFQVLCHTHNSEKGYYGTMTPAEYLDG